MIRSIWNIFLAIANFNQNNKFILMADLIQSDWGTEWSVKNLASIFKNLSLMLILIKFDDLWNKCCT